MKDKIDELRETSRDIKARLENVFNMDRNDGGSSSSLDSKDSKNGKCTGVPNVLDIHEKEWFRHSAKCDLEQLKKLYGKDRELLNRRDYFTGFAAIHWAAKKGRSDIITWLFEHNAEINIRTNGGYTALHLATIHKMDATIHKLINNFEADINIRDYSGKKARHFLSADLSASVTRALQETPSVMELIVDTNPAPSEGYMTPTSLRKGLSRKPMVRSNTVDKGLDDETGSGLSRMRKKGLSISNSFKMKKRSHYITKKEPKVYGEPSPPSHPRWQRSPSVPDIVYLSETDNRRKSFLEYASLVPMSAVDGSYAHDAIIPVGRKQSVSDMLINGYAGLINDNKHHRKPSTVENKEYSINTWI